MATKTKKPQTRKTTKSASYASFSKKTKRLPIGLTVVLVFGLIGSALTYLSFAAPPNRDCTRQAPYATIDNTYAWGATGTHATAGETVPFSVTLRNDDSEACGPSTFNVSFTAPSGFTYNLPSQTVTLGPWSKDRTLSYAYETVHVTSPTGIENGRYPLKVTMTRVNTVPSVNTSTYTSYYIVYKLSDDTTPPVAPLAYTSIDNLDGKTFSRTSKDAAAALKMQFGTADNYRSKSEKLIVDGVVVQERDCGKETFYVCSVYLTWNPREHVGTHTITHLATDFAGNTYKGTATFTIK